MKINHLLFLLVSWLLTTSLSAQLCWKITSPDKAVSSYLFGTHHLVEPSSIPHL
ncbi:MAG: TraB/GumN family protein, partial [Bacteroidales bacterium]|nr:TraB/GumN family protein [Bacteroidales bacterium]